MLNLDEQKKYFKNHIAKFYDYGNIKIIDFKAPEKSDYSIRFLFEEDNYRLHISGDLGELIACNYYNMTYEKFSDFVNDTGYFEQKILCSNRALYFYDVERAKTELIEKFDEDNLWEEFITDQSDYKSREDVINEICSNFDMVKGIGKKGYDILDEYILDAWEFAYDLGKTRSGILELYMLAYKLATKQLEKNNEDNEESND